MATEDKIGRQELVNKICGLVESLKKDSNFCLSINGAWGSGKSFVLDMIEEELSQHSEYIIVKYDAWKNSFYPDPLIAILYCVLDSLSLNCKQIKIRQYKKATTKVLKKTVTETVDKITDDVIEMLSKNGGWTGLAAAAIKIIRSIIKEAQISILDNKLFDDFKSYQDLLNEFIVVLNLLTTYEDKEHPRKKMVVLVDEIDRCLPNDQLKILERLHHLFDVKNCAVIVAMNHSCIAKTVKTLYGTDGNEYLRKFFDFVFKLDTSAEVYLNNLFDGFIKSCEKIKTRDSDAELQIKLAYQCMLYGDKKVLEKVDNRELTRYFDAVNRVCNDFGWQNLLPHYVFFILIALFIRRNVSSSFLDEKDIIVKQGERAREYDQLSYDERNRTLPYHDYLIEDLGIDIANPPSDICEPVGINLQYHVAESSYWFNEIVCYSLGGQYPQNEMRMFFHKPTVNSDDCKKLRELVLLYGGEQEKCER